MLSIVYVYPVVEIGRATRGIVEHSEGKGRERAMAIPRFLCGSSRLRRLRTGPFWP
jgi:hypothetical protein